MIVYISEKLYVSCNTFTFFSNAKGRVFMVECTRWSTLMYSMLCLLAKNFTKLLHVRTCMKYKNEGVSVTFFVLTHPLILIIQVDYLLFSKCELVDEAFCLEIIIEYGEYPTNINSDTTLKICVELYVARHCFPAAIECESDEFALTIEHA